MHDYLDIYRTAFLEKHATFKGRASRQEFWTFSLITTFILAIIFPIPYTMMLSYLRNSEELKDPLYQMILGNEQMLMMISASFVILVISLPFWIPLTSVSVRRLHDSGKSSWWFLISILPYIGGIILTLLFLLPGTNGPNRFGPGPYGNPATIEEVGD